MGSGVIRVHSRVPFGIESSIVQAGSSETISTLLLPLAR